MDYKSAGVDTHAGQQFVKLIGDSVKSTRLPHVMSGLGGFAALSDVSFLKSYKQPVLVSTTDGVGTKLHLARLFDRHETVGIDLVAMCVNDLLVTAAKPLIFLDYIACGKLNPVKMAKVVEGIANGCRQANCSLVGGETAEHPILLEEDEYDLGGFCVGVSEKDELIDGSGIKESDAIIAFSSSGIHSNGLSLVRKIFLKNGLDLPDSSEEQQFLLNEILLKPTFIYEKTVRPLIEKYRTSIAGMVHITGGGFNENVPRVIPDGLCARIDVKKIQKPVLFDTIQKKGNVSDSEMYSVFNMGAGLILVIRPDKADSIIRELSGDIKASIVGEVIRGKEKVSLNFG